jgi:hypothetical protein
MGAPAIGRADARSGNMEARAEYQKFPALWREADPDSSQG